MLSAKLLLDTLSEYALISQLIRAATPEEVCRAAGEILQRPLEPSPGLFDLFLRIDEYDGVYGRLSGQERDAFVNLVRYRLVPFPRFREAAFSRDREEKKQNPGKKPKTACALAPYERAFSNVELIKDPGLIPYLLHKKHGMECTMVSAPGGPYPYAELVRGLKFHFLENGSVETKRAYLEEHAKDMDLLILRGCYSAYFSLAPLYKRLNPSGKIYIGLDANSSWMDSIIFFDPVFQEFLDACDIIATSCSAMASHLSEKWGRNVLCLPNGYYAFSGREPVSFSEKKNVILTVGRLGTWQKATDVLINAFTAAGEFLKGWELRLVGSMEEEFRPWLEEFFRGHPDMEKRITFTGPIVDREALHREFVRAKIFALSSRLEGGAPNVIGEALNAGCAVACTKIDAWEDIIDGGKCGMASDIDDVGNLAVILARLAASDLENYSKEAVRRSESFYSMEKQVEKLYGML